MKVYKVVVVKKENNKRVSCFVGRLAEIVYSEKKYVKAPKWLDKMGYYPTAFDNLKAALKFEQLVPVFFGFDKRSEIWEADGLGIKRKLPPYLDDNKLSFGEIEKDDNGWTKGTVMVRKIKLIRRIK